ncbi:MAG: phosphate ABC transporter substrate-binding protein PstS [Nitrososphaerota archaeon]|uniref:phosphate ABC transporter substrate-binding protein PstS n=1 Tax=Candidatus Bathycorpusculum sp. TaxID=2994959 RepID=UPI0028179AA7|nr:phosphate ABC transporter substrate-binding protein PstS [Candidatus Termitimicrobium sp.]MCL2431080.1 phosphate ABC transporter substrate-binding protein PstS [Candidatus Termitimicrobium sp.]MDR0492215.1 phosphate ABC transporter substrate-binding protein PstS [Nitrososphaerota archaeon]
MKTTYIIAIAVIAIIIGSVAAYAYLSAPAAETISITASGATFPEPFLIETIKEYSDIKSNVQINYQGGGSGKGVTDLTNKVVDFACSDAPLSSSQRAAAPDVLHIPETIGAITVAYNIPGIETGLKLTGPIIADIFLGKITMWDDSAITTINPDLNLPHKEITVIHRSDGSGTTNWFTKYLSSVSDTWKTSVGANSTVQWPVGIGQSGNSGVAETVTSTEYAVGYIELAYTLAHNVPVAAIKNPAGNYIIPTLDATTAAAKALPSPLPSGSDSWEDIAILNTSGTDAYPIVTPTYMLVYKDLGVIPGMTIEKATAIVQYIWYVVHNGQQLGAELQYAALPSNLVQINEATLNSITFNGETVPTH